MASTGRHGGGGRGRGGRGRGRGRFVRGGGFYGGWPSYAYAYPAYNYAAYYPYYLQQLRQLQAYQPYVTAGSMEAEQLRQAIERLTLEVAELQGRLSAQQPAVAGMAQPFYYGPATAGFAG